MASDTSISNATLSPSPPPTSTATKAPRNLIVLCDGTSNQFTSQSSNVIKLMSCLQVDESQLVFYDSGVGSYLGEGASMWGELKQTTAKLADMAVAWNFDAHVCAGYRWLMDYYQPGDKVYIFGFSRGSYTARCLAGMIQKVGLLPAGNHSQVPLAWEVYKNPNNVRKRGNILEKESESLAAGYRRTFGISKAVDVHFTGVFDTVASIGGLDLQELPFAAGVRMVKFFRQALALDERRAKFQPVYRFPDPEERAHPPKECKDITHLAHQATKALGALKMSPKDKLAPAPVVQDAKVNLQESTVFTAPGGDTCGHADNRKIIPKSKEVWFVGCHSDCGGGNDMNLQPSLSNISFRWMIREAEQCGLKIDPAGLVLLPALSEVPTVAPHIPTKLKELLKLQLAGVDDEHDDEDEVRALIRKHLPPDVVHDLIKMAAAYDTTYDTNVAAGGPISEDLKKLPVESLTPAWWMVEALVLQTRANSGGSGGLGGEGDYTWRMNLGRGREMREGQAIHRSVQKKLRLHSPLDDTPTDKHPDYDGPHAKLPAGWRTTWDDLRLGKGPDVWED